MSFAGSEAVWSTEAAWRLEGSGGPDSSRHLSGRSLRALAKVPSNVGALMIRIEFGGVHYAVTIVRTPQIPILIIKAPPLMAG